jgi:flavin reductase (DIM6/NTAB) family NADH-FMN oxidoreductase RutF
MGERAVRERCPQRIAATQKALASPRFECQSARHQEGFMAATANSPDGVSTDTQRVFRQVMGRFATGVTVITTSVAGETFGMTANAFMAGSLEPPLCVVSIGRSAQMHGRLQVAGHFGVSFLSQEQQHFAAHFAGRRIEKLTPAFELHGRTPVLKRAVASITAEIEQSADCGDHTLFIGRITSMTAADTARPLLFYAGRYAQIDWRNPIEHVEPPQFW